MQKGEKVMKSYDLYLESKQVKEAGGDFGLWLQVDKLDRAEFEERLRSFAMETGHLEDDFVVGAAEGFDEIPLEQLQDVDVVYQLIGLMRWYSHFQTEVPILAAYQFTGYDPDVDTVWRCIETSYAGTYPTAIHFAEQQAAGGEGGCISKLLYSHVDWDGVTRDLGLDYEFIDMGGQVHVFRK